MKPISIRRTPKTLPRAVSDLVAEGGKILVGDDAPRAVHRVPAARAPADLNHVTHCADRRSRSS
ncbi:MAG: hypothetical protein ACK54C_08900 [Betaproteobacteria bacterium]|jgi:hypothetical protein